MANHFIKILVALVLGLNYSLYAQVDEAELERQLQEEHAAYEQYKIYVNEIRCSFAEQMKKEFNFRCGGVEGMMHGKVEELGMSFNVYRRATIEEARALELLVIDKFVQMINAHEKIQPFLEERPFTFKRVSISITFDGINRHNADGSVSMIYNVPDSATSEYKNYLVYRVFDPFVGQRTDLFEEPYEDAVKLNATSPRKTPLHPRSERAGAGNG